MADGIVEGKTPVVGLTRGAESTVLVTLADVQAAEARLRSFIPTSPIVRFGDAIHLKLESLQPTGSFKIRGALSKLTLLVGEGSDAAFQRQVVAYSSGNHARAVARAARLLGMRATIVMPSDAPRNKIDAVKRDGAAIVYRGTASEERRLGAEELARANDAILVPPYDDPLVIAGQGTIGLELVAEVANLRRVFVPIGGGGLASGIAVSIKALAPNVTVIGVEPESAADGRQSLLSGRIVRLELGEDVRPTIADGLRTQSLGHLPFHHLSAMLDDIVTVTDREIVQAMALLASEARLISEPSGAVALAACIRAEPADGASAVIVSGGNVDIPYYLELLGEAAARTL